MNNEYITLDEINLKSNENEPLNEFKKIPNNLEKFSSVNTIEENAPVPKRVNLFERKSKWMVNKKDSEKTIVNSNESHEYREVDSNQECSSSSLFEKYEEGQMFSPQDSLVNDDDFKIDQILNSETLVIDETCRTSTTEKSEPVTHSDTLVNDENFRTILIEPMEGSINSLESLYKFSPVVDEIIDETGALSDPDNYFEPKEDCYYLDNNNSSLQIDDNGIVYSDDSGSYDNIFNYNSDIILSDDEDIRKAKVDELYNEAMLLKNLDNNAFSFINDEPYPDYFDESIVDNTESADFTFLERDKINYRGSNASDHVDLRLNDLSDWNDSSDSFNSLDYSNVNPTHQHFENLSVKFDNNPSSSLDPYPNFQSYDGSGNLSLGNNSDFVSADDDAIYVINDMNDDHLVNQNIQFDDDKVIHSTKKKVTFDDRVRIKSIERIEIQDDINLKNYLKLKAGLQKLKNLFTIHKKKKPTKVGYQGEMPVVVIEYIDEVLDEYNRKEVLYFGKDYPKITIDFSEDLNDSIAIDEQDVFDSYNIDFDTTAEIGERTDSKLYHKNNSPTTTVHGKIETNNNNNNPKSILKNDNSEVVVKPSNDFNHPSKSNRNINDAENIPSYLHDSTPKKKKEKQKKAKKFIDKVMSMERNYYNQRDKDLTSLPNEESSLKKEQNPKESNSSQNEKKTKSKSYIKNIYKSFKNSIVNDNLINSKIEGDEKNESNVNISNVSVMNMKLENPNLKLLLEEEEEKETDSFQEILNLFENDNNNNNNVHEEILENSIQKPESNNENLMNDKLPKARSISGATDEKASVNEKDKENDESVNTVPHEKDESLKKKRKRSWSLFSLFKKNSHLKKSYSSSHLDEITDSIHELRSINEKNDSVHEVVNNNGHTYIIHKDINNGYTEVIHEESSFNKPSEEVHDPSANSSTSINYELDLGPSLEKEFTELIANSDHDNVNEPEKVKDQESERDEQKSGKDEQKSGKDEQKSERDERKPEQQEQKPEYQPVQKQESLAFNLDKMDSSLTETDILAKQVSKISSSTEMNQSSATIDYTQPQNQISMSSLNLKSTFIPQNSDQTILIQNNIMIHEDYPHSFQKVISQEKELKLKKEKNHIVMPTSEEVNDDLKKKSSPPPQPQPQPQQQEQPKKSSIEIKNNNNTTSQKPPLLPKKTFKPVVLPIDNENDFNKVDSIEVIDEYIIKCQKPFILHTENGEDREVNEIVIEDEITE